VALGSNFTLPPFGYRGCTLPKQQAALGRTNSDHPAQHEGHQTAVCTENLIRID
jgi:hypothetical protein